MALPIRLGRKAVATPHFKTEVECNASRLITGEIVDQIIGQSTEYKPNNERTSGIQKIVNCIPKKRGVLTFDDLDKLFRSQK